MAHRRWKIPAAYAALVALITTGLLALLFYPNFPEIPISAVASLVAFLMISRIRKRRERIGFGDVWLVIVIVFALSAIGAGIAGIAIGVNVDVYHFQTTSDIPGGAYEQLASAEGIDYLVPCRARNPSVIGVPVSQIESIRILTNSARASFRPSLWDLVMHHEHYVEGLQLC